MTILPFTCLGVGIFLGVMNKSPKVKVAFENVSTVALIFLMFSIGAGIGVDKRIISQFGAIGINCTVMALSAIFFSVIFVVICEKTVLPLKAVDLRLKKEKLGILLNESEDESEKKKVSNLVWIMPGSILLGLGAGIVFREGLLMIHMDDVFTVALIVLYICVGFSQGSNKEVFRYVKMIGLRVLWLSAAILVGSLIGGLVASLILDVPTKISLLASGGMSFYSITGAYMTRSYGLELGTYGFLVNVLREFFTVLLMPLLTKISLGSPIAGGAAGNMDTMLAPVTKFIGPHLGLVTLITGTILTFIVPFLLPILANL
ncbi:MAG: lysine exporter LysO family protein [Anaerovoracaceae bacterium]|jgi:uncharacterized membrane protein YbjE (DUF340 family)